MLHTGEIMSVFPCGKSLRASVEHRLYFEPSDRSSAAESDFVGLYANKRVQHLASIGTVVSGHLGSDGFVPRNTEKGELSREGTDRIEVAINLNFHGI